MTRILEADVAMAAGCELAEGPVWDPSRGLLRWVDILAGRVHARRDRPPAVPVRGLT